MVFWNKKCPRSRSETSRVCLIFSFFFIDQVPQVQWVLAREEEEAFSLLLAVVQHHLPPFHRAHHPVTSISGEGQASRRAKGK